jgi:biopolymer transport protein ExbD
MAGVDVGSGRGKRRSLDSELNMVPMIDLLMATISFLLLSAVWTHMSRIDADAQVPGKSDEIPTRVEPEKQLHITLQGEEKFVLAWKRGNTTVESMDVPRSEVVRQEGAVTVVRFPDLAAKIASEWRAKGQHASPTDRHLDQAVLHTDNKTEFKYLVGVIDAVYDARRDMSTGSKIERRPAFNVTFAVD